MMMSLPSLPVSLLFMKYCSFLLRTVQPAHPPAQRAQSAPQVPIRRNSTLGVRAAVNAHRNNVCVSLLRPHPPPRTAAGGHLALLSLPPIVPEVTQRIEVRLAASSRPRYVQICLQQRMDPVRALER